MDRDINASAHDFTEVKNYYNAVSKQYDSDLNTEINTTIRNYVKDYFIRIVMPCNVLDFGGGTGLDLPWLTANNYAVTFCEPSDGMKAKAKERIEQLNLQKVNILPNDKTDFHTWNDANVPGNNIDAVIANFNVLNNITDIGQLFKLLASIMNDGAHFIGTILNYSFFSLLKKNRSIALKSILTPDPLRVDTRANNLTQPVLIYSDNHLRKAYSNYFKLIADKPIKNTGFRLIHLQKFT